MNIESISITNFLTIKHAEIELAERGLLLIQGVNKDDSSADSNGAGKSSIADAICWALYGVTARGVTADAVVNKKAKKDTEVEIRLTDGANEYRIIRYRKHSTNKNVTLVQQKHPTPGTMPIDLHKGTERETQEVINALVGCSLEVFQAAVYAGQEKMPDLPSMTDKHLKLMIEEAAGVEVLAKAHSIARARALAAQSEYDKIGATMVAAQSQLLHAKMQLTDTETMLAAFEADRPTQAKLELTKIPPLTKRRKELTDEIATRDAIDYAGELDEIKKKFDALKGETDEQNRLRALAQAAQKRLTLAEQSARLAKQSHTAAVEGVRTVSEKVGEPCGECGKAYCEHDIEAAKKLREADLEAATEHLKQIAAEYKTAKTEAQTAQDAATAHESTMTDVSAMAARQHDIQTEVAAINRLKAEVERIDLDVTNVKSAAGVWLKKDNPYTKAKELLEAQVADLEAKIVKASADAAKVEEALMLAQDAVKVYGPAGVRAHILDTVTPYLNDRTAHYLSALADDNIHAVWNTLTTNAKGEVKEKFQIEVSNDKGAESFEGLSGGEKRKVRLATAMALQDMVASRASKPINIFIADEVDHALDESGLERLMTVLNEKARERGTVLVISHNSLSDWIDEVITVTKEAGYGQVAGATRK
jgi:DNA repair exonuclease SbcCD ATPase subunit